MGVVNARPKLEPGEELCWKAAANHVAGPSYVFWGMTSSSSGQLVVTDRRVFYQPSRVDTLFRQKRWERHLDAVTGIEIVDRDGADVFPEECATALGSGPGTASRSSWSTTLSRRWLSCASYSFDPETRRTAREGFEFGHFFV